MKICFLITGFSDGGAQKQCAFLANELASRKDVHLTLVYFNEGVHFTLIDTRRVNCIKIDAISYYDPRNVLKVCRIIDELRPDILVTWLHACDVYGAFVKLLRPGLRWVMTERDSAYPIDPRYMLRRIAGRFSDLIVANSDKGALYWSKIRRSANIKVVDNIVMVAPSVPELLPAKRAIAIGRLEPQKNMLTVVRAFIVLAQRRADIQFAVIGDGSERPILERAIFESGMGGRIELLGFRSDVAHQIQTCNVVASASRHEGLPNVLLEAISGRRLVVASSIAEHKALLGESYPYLLENLTDELELSILIEKAIEGGDDIGILSYAQKRIGEMTSERVGDRYLSLFKEVIGNER